MVQRPFSHNSGTAMVWSNTSGPQVNKKDYSQFSSYSHNKASYRGRQRPRMSTIISSVDNSQLKSFLRENQQSSPVKFQGAVSKEVVANAEGYLKPKRFGKHYTFISSSTFNYKDLLEDYDVINNTYNTTSVIIPQSYFDLPKSIEYFQSNDDHSLKESIKKNTIYLPENFDKNNNSTSMFAKAIYTNTAVKQKLDAAQQKNTNIVIEDDINEKPDFLVEVSPSLILQSRKNYPIYNHNVTEHISSCSSLEEVNADIDLQKTFLELDIEPTWCANKSYWNHIFDSRYESLLRNSKWPPLKVILVPRSHVDTIWRQTFDQYHNNAVYNIISNIVKKLNFYSNMTFTWNEVSHLSQWWKMTTQKNRSSLRRLLKGGRLEITTGGWVEADEATSHIFGLVHQLIEGHQWLKLHLNITPKVAWLTNSVTHSPTLPYLLSLSDMWYLVFTNVHYAWEKYLAEFQYSDFIWVQNWDNDKFASSNLNDVLSRIGVQRLPKHAVFSHFLQFNAASFKACGPNKVVCVSDFNFGNPNKNFGVNSYNVKEKAELLLELYSKSGTITSHNVIMAPLGGPFHYESQAEFDFQYDNYQKLADFVNLNKDIYKASIGFGTARDYFNSIFSKHSSYPTVKGDFLNFADITSGKPAYWAGFFTTRPKLKILLRRLEATLRSTEILFTFGISHNVFEGVNTTQIFNLLIKSRKSVAQLSDRNVLSGTLTANVVKAVFNQILDTVKDCWKIQEVSASLLSIKPEQKRSHLFLQKYVYRDGDFISIFRSVVPGDSIYIFNSLAHERTEVISLLTAQPNMRIVDNKKKDIAIQVTPVWKYNSRKIKISQKYFKIVFTITIQPMTLELFKLKETYDAKQSAALVICSSCILDEVRSENTVFPFIVRPIEAGDIQLESYKHRLIFDEYSGFLKSVVEKQTNIEKSVLIDYGTFKSSDENAGMYLFNTNVTHPVHDILMPYRVGEQPKVVIIISGLVTTSISIIFGKLLQHTVQIFNLPESPLSNAIYVESIVDYESSPKNRELELFMSLQTDIGNGNPPQIYTDNNGFQYTSRVLNMSRRIESNMYPITTMVYLQDNISRLTVITDHAQGVTALQEGHIAVLLDRRILFNDGRGPSEGLADSSETCHRHFILLENFHAVPQTKTVQTLHLPSLSALYLSNSLNYPLDSFLVDSKHTDFRYYSSLPLIKGSFPCDVSILNFRVIFNKENHNSIPNTALMVLHRQSFSCRIDHHLYQFCDRNNEMFLDKLLRNAKAIYKTNLSGTSKGSIVRQLNLANFPAMEVVSLRIHF